MRITVGTLVLDLCKLPPSLEKKITPKQKSQVLDPFPSGPVRTDFPKICPDLGPDGGIVLVCFGLYLTSLNRITFMITLTFHFWNNFL